MKLFWTPEAIDDRRAIYAYIESDNPSAALTLDELFSQHASHLVDHPALVVSMALANWSRIRITS